MLKYLLITGIFLAPSLAIASMDTDALESLIEQVDRGELTPAPSPQSRAAGVVPAPQERPMVTINRYHQEESKNGIIGRIKSVVTMIGSGFSMFWGWVQDVWDFIDSLWDNKKFFLLVAILFAYKPLLDSEHQKRSIAALVLMVVAFLGIGGNTTASQTASTDTQQLAQMEN